MRPRVVVADDSAYVRRAVRLSLERGGIDVVGEATDGIEAVEKTQELEPDVVVLDLQMPRANGVEALRRLRGTGAKVLIFASMDEVGAELALHALAEGAADVLPKPREDDLVADLVPRVWMLVAAHRKLAPPPRSAPELIVIAASTGGPQAVERIVTRLPADLRAPVVVAQHMPPIFTSSFAKRLDARSPFPVAEGHDGARVSPGTAWVLPGGLVSTLSAGTPWTLRCRTSASIPGPRPNASVFLFSAMAATRGRIALVVLSGMGADGADAVAAIRLGGGTVLVQDPKEAVISSMPNAAIAAGATRVAALGDLLEEIGQLARGELALAG